MDDSNDKFLVDGIIEHIKDRKNEDKILRSEFSNFKGDKIYYYSRNDLFIKLVLDDIYQQRNLLLNFLKYV